MIQLERYKCTVNLLESAQELSDYLSGLSSDSVTTFDWETTGLEYDTIPLGLSLCQRGENPSFTPVDYFFSKGVPMTEIADICNREFKRLKLIAHNAKFDSMINVMNGIKDENCNIVADTLGMIHLYDPNLDKNLEKRVAADFGYEKQTFEKICGKKWTKINWSREGDELLQLLAGYSGEDSFWETQVYYKYRKLLDEDAWRVLRRIELPMIKILRDAKIRGVKINVPLLNDMYEVAKDQLVYRMNDIYDAAGCVFNINSNPQKQKVFFEKLKLPIISYTRSKQPSTDSESAKAWASMGYPIGKALVAYSELQKLISGYLKPIPELVDENNILRGDINSFGTKTGRCSSSNPNLQNQPNNHDFPIRESFIPRPGYVFINYDYSQLELRVMAHMSKDETFIEMFKSGRDPHGEVAKSLGVTRKQAKVANFGVLYGLSVPSFAREFGVSEGKATEIINNYHTTYRGFAQWKVKTENFAKKNGYVKNLFGRKRVLKMAAMSQWDKNFRFSEYNKDLRRAVNTVIQGTGADIVKLATIAMCNKFEELGLDAHFLLQVHDEVLIEARIDQMFDIEKVVVDCMQNTVKLDVPLIADGKIITNWGEMKDDSILSLPYRFDYSLYSSLL